MRVTRIIIKIAIVLLLAESAYDNLQFYKEYNSYKPHKDFASGIYDVTSFAINADTLPPLTSDSIRWQDFIIDRGTSGSVKTKDSVFRQRYGRGYFYFEADSTQPIIHFWRSDSIFMSLHYKRTDSNSIQLWGKKFDDSLFVELKKSPRTFQLAEKQFHWLSEANR